MCEDCEHNIGYCELFDDVLSYENCIFKKKGDEE